MKRLFVILVACLAMSCPVVLALPDGGAQQRVEASIGAPDVQGAQGRITFYAGNNDATFSIYSITGQLVKVVRVPADQHATVEMPKGFYIVKCGGQWSRKVVVK